MSAPRDGEGTTGEYQLALTQEHTAARATPLGAAAARGDKRVGLRLFGVAAVDQHTHAATPFAAGTELIVFRDLGAVVRAARTRPPGSPCRSNSP